MQTLDPVLGIGLSQTRTQSLLCMRCDLWVGFSAFAVHQGKDGRITPLCASNCLSIFLCENK